MLSAGTRNPRSNRVPTSKAGQESQQNNLQVQTHTPISHIVKIILDPLRNGCMTSTKAVYLGPPGDSTFDVMSCHIPRNLLSKFLDKESQFRAWSNDAHIAP